MSTDSAHWPIAISLGKSLPKFWSSMSEEINLGITAWYHYKDPHGRFTTVQWSKLVSWFDKPRVVSDKFRLPGYSFAKFQGNYRDLDHFEEAFALVFDYDKAKSFLEVWLLWSM